MSEQVVEEAQISGALHSGGPAGSARHVTEVLKKKDPTPKVTSCLWIRLDRRYYHTGYARKDMKKDPSEFEALKSPASIDLRHISIFEKHDLLRRQLSCGSILVIDP